MERKNTMLLTVIAVATLLVAVVGATFAYFTATTSGTASSTISVTTEANSGAIASGVAASIYVSAAEMANDTDAQKTYTAATTNFATDDDGYVQVLLTNGSAENTYTCTYNLVYTGTEYEGEEADITLTVTPDTTGTGTLSSEDPIVISFSSLTSGDDIATGLTYTVPVSTSSTALKYTVALSVTNTTSDQTLDLAGKTITGSVSVGTITCVHNS